MSKKKTFKLCRSMAVPVSQSSIIIENLLEATSDRVEKVRNAIYSSLQKVAHYYPSEIISSAISYRRRNPKLNNQEVRCIYILIKNVCEEKLQHVDNSLLQSIMEYAVDESLKSAEAPFISADLLPVIGTKYCTEVYECIARHMPEGVAPHASIIFIIGNLSVANMSSFLPFVKNAFNYLLSILLVTKTDNMRRIYATTVCQLVETVIEQTPPNEMSVTKETYSPIVEEIFETFVTVWLQIKDIKTCEIIVQATGSAVLLFSDQKLMNDSSRIVNTFLGLYKKTPMLPRYVITQAISNFLSVITRSALQSSLEPLLHSLHVMVCITPDFTQPVTVKNYSEILRCYDHIGVLFEDKLCEVILRNLRSTSEQDRIVGLLVASHLLNSSEKVLKPKISEITALLRNLLDETSVKINRSLVKLITSLAYRDCLTEKDCVFIEFLIKHCHHITSNADLNELESMCKSTIYLFATNIVSVQPLCWKVLLHMFMNGESFHGVETFAKALAYLISKCDPATLEKNCYERSEIVFVRVVSLLGSPLHENRGVPLLKFLHDYILWKVKVDTIIWRHKISKLIAYLEDSDWQETEWEDKLLDALSGSFTDDIKPWLGAVNMETVKILSEQSTNNDYNHNTSINNVTVDERSILFKLLALLTCYVDDDSTVNGNVDRILSPITQRSLVDLKACARSVGILSKTNFNLVFKQVEYLQKTQLTRKTTKFLGFIKDTKYETDVEVVRRMICECYSSMIVNAPASLLLLKLKDMLVWLISVLQSSKDSQTKNACLESLLKGTEIILKNENDYENLEECKNDLMSFILTFIEGEKSMPSVTCLKIVIILFKLSANTSATDKLQLLQKCLNKMFQYYSVSSSTSAISENDVINDDAILRQLCLLIEETIKTKHSTILEEIVVFLQPWLSHRLINHRIISLFLLRSALVCYTDCYLNDTQNFVKFSQVSSLLGRVYIRTFENNTTSSTLAGECVILLLAVAEANADTANTSTEQIRHSLTNFKHSSLEFFRVATYCKLTPEQLSLFTENLINGLSDSETCCSLGTAKLLQVLFMEIGSQFQRQALDIFGGILLRLTKMDNEELQIATIEAALALAHHHKDMFVNTMLNQTLPFHATVCKCWHKLAEDEKFTDEILIRLLETIKWSPLEEENKQNSNHKTISIRPIAAVCAVKEILDSMNTTEIVRNHFPDLFSSILMLIPCYMGGKISGNDKSVKEPVTTFIPAKMAFDTLLLVMQNANCKHIEESLSSCNEKVDFKQKSDKQPSYYDVVRTLAKAVSYFNNDSVVKILLALGGYEGEDRTEAQRGTVAVFYVEIFDSKCCEDITFVDTIITNLLHLLTDSNSFVRETSLVGLAMISNLGFSLIERYKDRILSALVQGLDDNEATVRPGIIIQSLSGLSKLLPFLNDERYASIFGSLAVRIKAFFEKEDTEIRRLSLKLFGELANVSHMDSFSFSEQVGRNLICLLFHLGEKESSIVQACKFSLRSVAPVIKSPSLSDLIQKHLIDDGKLHYQEYVIKVAEILAIESPEFAYDYIMTALSYTKSSWPEIRATAAIFVGILYKNQTPEFFAKLPPEDVSSRLMFLLKDADLNVRANTAIGLGSLLQIPVGFVAPDIVNT